MEPGRKQQTGDVEGVEERRGQVKKIEEQDVRTRETIVSVVSSLVSLLSLGAFVSVLDKEMRLIVDFPVREYSEILLKNENTFY